MKLTLLASVLGALVIATTDGSTVVQTPQPAGWVSGRQITPKPAPSASAALANAAQLHMSPRPATVKQLRTLGPVPFDTGPFFRGGSRLKKSATLGGTRTSLSSATTSATIRSSTKTALYNGLNKQGISASADSPSENTPPDSTGAIGPNNYVEMANSIIHVWDRNLNTISSTTLDSFVSLPGDPLCDPQVQWDPAAGRWLYAILLCNTQTTTQFFLFGWSKTSDPSNLASGWCTDFGFTTDPFLFDFPKLGHNSKWLIIGGNFYDETNAPNPNPPFLSAAIFWIQLPANGTTTCPSTFPAFGDTANASLFNGDHSSLTFTPVPVNTDTTAANGYILSAYDPSGSNGQTPAPKNALAVWHLDSSGVLHQDSDIAVNTYDTPPNAPEPGGNTLDTLFAQLTQAVGDPTTGIWTQHTVAGGAGSQVTWYELDFNGSALVNVQGGNLTSATDYVFNAAISPSSGGHGAAIFYNRSSSSTDPVVASQVRANSTPLGAMAPGELVLATSSTADMDFSCSPPNGPPCRWGDYSGASPDPVIPYVVWGTNEYNTGNTSVPAWQDENFAVAAAVPPGAPSNVHVLYGGTDFECVTWTLSTLDDGGAPDLSYTIKAFQGATLAQSVTVNAPAALACVKGLASGLAYTFTLAATNIAGTGADSSPSAPFTIVRETTQSTSVASPTRTGTSQSSPAPSPPPR